MNDFQLVNRPSLEEAIQCMKSNNNALIYFSQYNNLIHFLVTINDCGPIYKTFLFDMKGTYLYRIY